MTTTRTRARFWISGRVGVGIAVSLGGDPNDGEVRAGLVVGVGLADSEVWAGLVRPWTVGIGAGAFEVPFDPHDLAGVAGREFSMGRQGDDVSHGDIDAHVIGCVVAGGAGGQAHEDPGRYLAELADVWPGTTFMATAAAVHIGRATGDQARIDKALRDERSRVEPDLRRRRAGRPRGTRSARRSPGSWTKP